MTHQATASRWFYYLYSGNLPIYGEVYSIEEMERIEKSLGSDDREWQSIRRMLENIESQGSVYGRCYSEVEPGGDIGTTSTQYQQDWEWLTQEEFNRARGKGWPRR